jgi:hypothetical protein
MEELVRGGDVAKLLSSLGRAEVGEVLVHDAVGRNVVVDVALVKRVGVVRRAVAEQAIGSDVCEVDVCLRARRLALGACVWEGWLEPIRADLQVVDARDCRLRVCDIGWRGRVGTRRSPVEAKGPGGVTPILLRAWPGQDRRGLGTVCRA